MKTKIKILRDGRKKQHWQRDDDDENFCHLGSFKISVSYARKNNHFHERSSTFALHFYTH